MGMVAVTPIPMNKTLQTKNGKPILTKGTPFTAEFRVVAPAVSPVGVPDPVAIKPGIAEFITTNVTVKAG